jgi:hypothetical protein
MGNYGENSMACVQVDFVQALLPAFPKKFQFLYYISAKSKQTLYRDSGNLFRFVSYLYRGLVTISAL